MMTNINYELTIDYNYDSERDMIIETRCVKRILENKCTQYLKSNFQTLESSAVPSNIYESVRNGDLYTYDLQLSQDELDKVMEQKYDLFNYGAMGSENAYMLQAVN